MSDKRFEVDIYTLPTTITDNVENKTYSSMRSLVNLLNSLSEENEELKSQRRNDLKEFFKQNFALKRENEQLKINNARLLDKQQRDRKEHYFKTNFEECKKLVNETERLREKVEELTFQDYKRRLEIIKDQRITLHKIEKLTGQTIEEIIPYLEEKEKESAEIYKPSKRPFRKIGGVKK